MSDGEDQVSGGSGAWAPRGLMPTNSLNFDCDWQFGFNVNARSKGTVGYLLFWSGCGGLSLAKDIEVWNPYSSAGQTIVTGEKVKCIALIDTFRYDGGEDDPIQISAFVSKDTAADIRAKLARPLASVKVKVIWYVVAYDNDKKNWYEAAFVRDNAKVEANIDTADGKVQMFIDNASTRIVDTLDINVFRFTFQLVPAAGSSANLEFATGPTQRIVRSWKSE